MDYLDLIYNFIINHQNISYFVLFLGALFDTLFPIGFFIYGEIFFLTGAFLAGAGILDIYYVCIFLFGGGILGDNLSYLFGKKYGRNFFKKLNEKKWFSKIIKPEAKQKFENLLDKRGAYMIFLTRIGGPFAWITPFILGSLDYKYFKFFRYNFFGVVFGISIFIIIGYFFGSNYENILDYIFNYIFLFLLFSFSIFITYSYVIKYVKIHKFINISYLKNTFKRTILKAFFKHTILYSSIIFFTYCFILYLSLFVYDSYKNQYFNFSNQIESLSSISSINSNTYFILNDKKTIQPINFIIITNSDINDIFGNLGRQENKIIQKDKITLKEYLRLFENKTLPVTNMTLLDKNQDFAFQMPGVNNKKRIHLRGWNYGTYQDKNVYLITISLDNEYEIDMYNNFITPIHEIDKNVDNSRNLLYKQFLKDFPKANYLKLRTNNYNKNNNYNTDGYIYIANI